MCDKDRCDLRLVLNASNLFPGLQTQTRVKVGEWLIQKQNARHFYQRAGDGNTLLLPAGKFFGFAIHQFFNLHKFCCFKGTLCHFLLGELCRTP